MDSHNNSNSVAVDLDEKRPAPLQETHTALPDDKDDKGISSGEQSPIASPVATDHGHGDEDPAAAAERQRIEEENIEKQYERPRYKIALIMLSLCLAVFMAALDITIVTTALPTISADFHSSSGYTWIGSAYLLATAASTLIWGKMSDVFGRKPALLVANFIFFVGSLVAALSINIGMLITARAIQGLGCGGLVALSNVCVGDLFSPRRRGAYYGIIGGVWAIASALGPILGGAFTEKVTWRWCFYINLPFDGLAFVILLLFLDIKTPRTPLIEGLKTIDWLGAFFVVGGTLMFLFGLEYGGVTYPWDSATVICLIVIGIFTFGLFILTEIYVAKNPVMPVRIICNRSNAASLAACAIQSFAFIGSNYYLPLYFQASLGATPLLSGVYLLALALALSFTSATTGFYIRKTGSFRQPIMFSFILTTVGYGLLINLDAHSSWAKIILYQIVLGLGIGPNFQAPLIALQSGINPKDIGTATSLFAFTRNLFTSISVVIGSVIFQNEFAKKAASNPGLAPIVASSGGGPGASIGIVGTLGQPLKGEVQQDFATSLQPVWILYTAISALGIIDWFLIGNQTLSKQHEETKTGLEAERERREEMQREKAEKAARKRGRQSGEAA